MNIQQILDEEKKKSELHKLREGKIALTIANREKANDATFRKNLAKAKIGKKRPDMLGDKNIAKTAKERLRRSLLMKGKPKSKTQLERYSESYKNLPLITCPHCHKQSQNQGNMNRYHFDNCKHK